MQCLVSKFVFNNVKIRRDSNVISTGPDFFPFEWKNNNKNAGYAKMFRSPDDFLKETLEAVTYNCSL